MSLAWAPIAIIILLFPGIFFFIGLSSYERLSREIIRSSVVSEVAMATAIGIAIHFVSICILSAFGFRLSQFLVPFVADYQKASIAPLVERALGHTTLLVLYLAGTTMVGFVLGLVVAVGVVSGPLRRIALHKWIYDIIDIDRKGGIVTAFVMTTMVDESRIIMYKGRLHDIFLAPDGSVSYLILKNCFRYYMTFKDDELVTSKQLELFGESQGSRPPNVWDRLMIHGSNISNVLFDSSGEIKGQAEGAKVLDDEYKAAIERSRLLAMAAAERYRRSRTSPKSK